MSCWRIPTFLALLPPDEKGGRGKPGEHSQEHVASFPISSVCQRPTFSAAWAPGGPRAVRSLPPAWPCACVLPTQPAALASRISGLFCGGYSPGDHSLVKLNPGGRGGKDSCSRLAFHGVKIPAGTALPALWAKPQPARPAPLPCQRGQRDCGCRLIQLVSWSGPGTDTPSAQDTHLSSGLTSNQASKEEGK